MTTEHSDPTGDLDLSAPEFQDQAESFNFGGRVDWAKLASRPTLMGFLAAAFGVYLLLARESELGFIFAIIFLMAAALGILDVRRSGGGPAEIARIAVAVAIAAALIFSPRFTTAELGMIVGGSLIVWGFVVGLRGIRNADSRNSDVVVRTLLWLAIGSALVVYPDRILEMAVLILAFYWLVGGLLTVAMNLRRSEEVFSLGSIWPSTMEWLQTKPHSAADRRQLYDKIFYEGTEATRRLSRFLALMSFATSIAAFGIIADSTAVVIGAMLVAPLMTPLMGTSLSMVMGWPRRATTSAGVALAGIGVAIGLGVVFGWVYPVEISPELNSQVASRIGPTLVDLAIAIAAGGAGAFALSRPDVSDSLPGVAVAIALVPPLAVVGLMISQNDWDQAFGALLLFVTNLLAILLVGALVFVATGVVPVTQLRRNSAWVGRVVTMVGIVAILVVAILSVSTEAYQAEIQGTVIANQSIDDWLEGTDLVRVSSTVSAGRVTATVEGPKPPPPIETLADDLAAALGRGVDVSVFFVPRTTFEYETGG